MKSPSGSSYIDEDGECEPAGGAMLQIFLDDFMRNNSRNSEVVEVKLEIDKEENVVARGGTEGGGIVERILRRLSSGSSGEEREEEGGKVERTRTRAESALKGLKFINGNSNNNGGKMDEEELWKQVERRFELMAKEGLLSRDDFGECIGMVDSKDFAGCVFDALARRKRQKVYRISKEELRDFWLQLSDQSFDARLQIFFDMADSNGDGRITREEVQELIMLSASANKLSKLEEQAEEYASLIMEELDPENLGYIELWQLETLLLQRDTYLNHSRSLSTESIGWSQNSTSLKPHIVIRHLYLAISSLILENWQRGWILVLWITSVAWLFGWKFDQYRSRAAFHVMGYCLPIAKGAAETLKLNMALILLPVCRKSLTWLRSTKARSIVPFDDNINFHKMIACGIAIGVIIHAGNHLFCDFPRLIHSSPRNFASIASDFNDKEPTYKDLLRSVEGVTGISMVVLMVVSFILATRQFRKSLVKLPQPLSRLTGFNAFWYSHHLLGLVYILLPVHGSFLFLAQKWYQKTTWMYVSAPLLVYIAERSARTYRSEHYSVRILKVSVLPGSVFSLTMSKPRGFKYRSGQYMFLQCPSISSLEWHPFSMTSAPGDDHLRIHIRTVGDWTQELKKVLTEVNNSPSAIGQAKFNQQRDQLSQLRLLVDGPYGAPAQDYHDYEVLLLVGLGIGATPFISILRDLTNIAKTPDYQTDSNTESSKSDDSLNSCTSSTSTKGGKKRQHRTTTAHFVWVTRDPGSFEWFKEVLDEVAEIDHKGQIEMHSYLTSMYEEGDARSTLITLVQALNHAKHGVDILSGTRVRTHFARPNWRQLLTKIASKHPFITVGVFYCGMPLLAKELKKLCQELNRTTSTRFEFHKEYF